MVCPWNSCRAPYQWLYCRLYQRQNSIHFVIDPERIVVAQWLFKTAYEALATPLTYLIVGIVKRRENIDTYDYDTDFNPLKLFSL